MKLRALVVAISLVLTGSVVAPATGASSGSGDLELGVASKVKGPAGVISDVTLARNPDNAHLLAVYESNGDIYATVLKPAAAAGRYTGRKARRVSVERGVNYRPSATWAPALGMWVVAWDTGPEGLLQATRNHADGSAPLDDSDIRARSLRASNGKPTGPEVSLERNGSVQLGAQAFIDFHSVGERGRAPGSLIRFVANEPSKPTATLYEIGVPELFLSARRPEPVARHSVELTSDQLLVTPRGTTAGPMPGTSVHPLDIFGPDSLATASAAGGNGGIFDADTTPGEFHFVNTTAAGFVVGPNLSGPLSGTFLWRELAGCFYQHLSTDLRRVGPVRQFPAMSCASCIVDASAANDIFAALDDTNDDDDYFDITVLSLDAAGAGRRAAATEARVYRWDREAEDFVPGPVTIRSQKGSLDAFVLLGAGRRRLYVLWAEVKNRKSSKLWLEVIEPAVD